MRPLSPTAKAMLVACAYYDGCGEMMPSRFMDHRVHASLMRRGLIAVNLYNQGGYCLTPKGRSVAAVVREDAARQAQ